MDILSDVKINGDLTLSNNLKVISSDFVSGDSCTESYIICASQCSFYVGVDFLASCISSNAIKVSEFVVDNRSHLYNTYLTGTTIIDSILCAQDLCFRRTNNHSMIDNYSRYQSISPFEVPIDVPADCSRFHIIGYPMEFLTGSNYNGNYPTTDIPDSQAIHPLVTAWCGGKKIEMDLELCLGEKDGFGKITSEFVIGSVTPSSRDRSIRVILY